jgi:hypothetical protein
VMATLKGTDPTDDRWWLSGHLDSCFRCNGCKSDAPGANDDASGSSYDGTGESWVKRISFYLNCSCCWWRTRLYGAKHLADVAKDGKWNVLRW